ncbi:hypothetical protein BC829DRAFT_402479 [Chytridium lagenaria]|nr:hypothetical protein BC829DRAFT_402479 [Chytridium lagenaria]
MSTNIVRQTYTVAKKLQVVEYALIHGRNRAADEFKLCRPMVGRWVKARERLLSVSVQGGVTKRLRVDPSKTDHTKLKKKIEPIPVVNPPFNHQPYNPPPPPHHPHYHPPPPPPPHFTPVIPPFDDSALDGFLAQSTYPSHYQPYPPLLLLLTHNNNQYYPPPPPPPVLPYGTQETQDVYYYREEGFDVESVMRAGFEE